MESEESGKGGARDILAGPEKHHDGFSYQRNDAGNVRAHFCREERQFIPREKISAEAESEDEEEHHHAGVPGELPWFAIGFGEQDAEHVHHGREDEKVGRPAVNRTNKPSELNLGHQELDALEGECLASLVIQEEQDARDHLDEEQEQRNAAEVVPDGMPVDGNILLSHERNQAAEVHPFVEPGVEGFQECVHVFFATKTSLPLRRTRNSSSGRGGGPSIFLPVRSYFPL